MLKNKEMNLKSKSGFYLGFDCATKTFAFSLSYIDFDPIIIESIKLKCKAIDAIMKRIQILINENKTIEAIVLINSIIPKINELNNQSMFIKLIDGETIDLFPGRADDTISTVERLRALSRYINSRIKPAIEEIPNIKIIVEFQMGHNSKAKSIASAIVALFAEEDVIIVGPSLKNKIYISDEGRYCKFSAKYASSYTANKAHAKFNFLEIERLFGTMIPATKPANLRGHIADSFMQILGHLAYGSDELQF